MSGLGRMGGGGRPRMPRPMRGVSCWILVLMIVAIPLPFGGARDIWEHLLTVLVAFGLLSFVWQRWRLRRPMPRIPGTLVFAGVILIGVAVWALIQATPGMRPTWTHPAWPQAFEALGTSGAVGAMSVVPEHTRSAALLWITYVSLGLLVALHARAQTNADLLLRTFMLAQGVYAAYGITIHLFGLDTVLWFEKWAYQGSVTSTFINRNSYATYAGLGLLATLALLLRHVRRVSRAATDTRSTVLTLQDGLWMQVLIPVTILSVGTLALLLTGSRMGLAAFALATVAFLAIWIGRSRGPTRWIGGGMIAALLIMAGANFMLSGETTLARFDAVIEHGDDRFAVYPLILDAIRNRPWVGHGLGTFANAFRPYRDETVQAFFDRGHSDWLELPMDVGLPAAGMVVLAFGMLAIRALMASMRADEPELPLLAVAAIILVGVHASVDFSLQIPAVMVAFVLLVMLGLSNESRPTSTHDAANSTSGSDIHGSGFFTWLQQTRHGVPERCPSGPDRASTGTR